MEEKIYEALLEIKKELQAIRSNLESQNAEVDFSIRQEVEALKARISKSSQS